MKNFRFNEDVRSSARAAGIPLWAIAYRLGVSEATLTRWLRTPLDAGREKKIRDIILELGRAQDGAIH